MIRTRALLNMGEAGILREFHPDVDFWTDPRPGMTADMMVAPELRKKLMAFLDSNDISHKVIIEDVQE